MGLRGRVEVRKPTGIKSLPEEVSDPAMSGAICMALRALERIDRDNHVERKPITVVNAGSSTIDEEPEPVAAPSGMGAKIRSLLGR